MITKTEDTLKVEALDYAMKRKIVNEKAINAYIAGYKSCEREFTIGVMLTHVSKIWGYSDKDINESAGIHGAYSGWEAEKRERTRMEKEREVALKVKEALDIFKTIKQ